MRPHASSVGARETQRKDVQQKHQTDHHHQTLSLFTTPTSPSLCDSASMATATKVSPAFSFHRPSQSTPKAAYESRDKPLPLVSIEKVAELDERRKKNTGTPRSYSHYREEFSHGSWLDTLTDATVNRASVGSSMEGAGPFDLERFIATREPSNKLITRAPSSPQSQARARRRPRTTSAACMASPTTPPTAEDWLPNPHDTSLATSSMSPPSSALGSFTTASFEQNEAISKVGLVRSVSESEALYDTSPPFFSRPPKSSPLPDPSNFPDPYPYGLAHHQQTVTPALSSAGSASTRSSGYTNPGSTISSSGMSIDYSHVRVVSGEETDGSRLSNGIGLGITSDSMVEMLARASNGSSLSSGSRKSHVAPTSRAGQSHSKRRRAPSQLNNEHVQEMQHGRVDLPLPLRSQPSYDSSWQFGDEDRDDYGITSEEEMDYGDHQSDVDDGDREEQDQEPTSAAVLADEGRGLIARGDGIPITQLNVQFGTTHLLLGGSSTPNAVPSFLLSTLPQVASTLLALDISANYLNSLPPSLSACVNLEELNISSNPLRVLPVFLGCLTSIRVLIADSTGIVTLPDRLSAMEKLHTLSIRRNKMHALPSWLCLLPSLESLLVDGNPFQGPWKALVDPLLAKTPTTPIYPLSTPMFPQPSASLASTAPGTDTEPSDSEGITEHDDSNSPTRVLPVPSSAPLDSRFIANLDDEHTITPANARLLERSVTSPSPHTSTQQHSPHALSRNRTTPSRPFHERAQSGAATSSEPNNEVVASMEPSTSYAGQRQNRAELRRMRSADELRRVLEDASAGASTTSTRPPIPHANTFASGSHLRQDSAEVASMSRRFASLGVGSRAQSSSRSLLSYSGWADHTVEEDADADVDSPPRPPSRPQTATSVFRAEGAARSGEMRPSTPVKARDSEKKEGRKWGFLKKMSMGKLKTMDGPASSRPSTPQGLLKPSALSKQIGIVSGSGSIAPPAMQPPPQIDIAVSAVNTTPSAGNSNGSSSTLSLPVNTMPTLGRKQSSDALRVPPSPASGGLLSPQSPGAKSARRRSFLPIDGPPALNIPIPSTAPFLQGITATNGDEHDEAARANQASPIVQSPENLLHKEEDRSREANARALRSVMAYLKDMNDLAIGPSGSMSIYSNSSSQMERHRRPTIGESSRINSETSMDSVDSSSSAPTTASSHLRSLDSLSGKRGSSNATMSVATSDSGGSNNEERKQKDDRAKRLNVIREIVETERTYVKQLQELVDIYIHPSSAPVSVLGSSNKETVIPANERKIVFGGLESLLIFHRDSFLPALERASKPSFAPNSSSTDSDGSLSANVAMDVGRTILSHAAFMKMYSSYINNYENSLRRVHMWQSERSGAASAAHSAPITPSSSSAQLVNLGLSLSAISAPGAVPDASATVRAPPLSSSQRKRICRFVKRCRLNPRHSQLNLDGYLLLPVQRIPRYRLLLEELVRITPAPINSYDDPLDRALTEISVLAQNMNEEKRESESRNKLVHWQQRIKGKFPSPLVQPHRRLIMDGKLMLTRVVRKQSMNFEVLDSHGDAANVSVECLSPELTPRPLVGILCNDLLVLCRDPSDGQDRNSPVELWAVLRMQTLPQPASIVHGNALRIVDNKAILYFEAPTTSDALTWFRAINLHIPSSASKV